MIESESGQRWIEVWNGSHCPLAPRALASRGTIAAQKNLFEPVSNFSDLVLANGCTLEYAIFLDYATFAYVHIRENFLFRSVSGP